MLFRSHKVCSSTHSTSHSPHTVHTPSRTAALAADGEDHSLADCTTCGCTALFRERRKEGRRKKKKEGWGRNEKGGGREERGKGEGKGVLYIHMKEGECSTHAAVTVHLGQSKG